MAQYSIFAGNMPNLDKRLTRIQNKCNKYGLDFHYEVIGEELKEVKDENGYTYKAKFIRIDVTGCMKIDGWRFIAKVEHTDEGNIIRQLDTEINVPVIYRTTDCICDHCHTSRKRKDTFLLFNESTQEWKQVGRSCLAEFTNGLDAEACASYASSFDALIAGNEFVSSRYVPYYEVEDILLYAHECVKHFGYFRAGSSYSTADRTFDYYACDNGLRMDPDYRKQIKEDMQSVNFCADTADNHKFVSDAISWILGVSADVDDTYYHNLQTICKSKYVDAKHMNILVSLVTAYQREVDAQKVRAIREEVSSKSKHVGSIGDRLCQSIQNAEHVSTFDTAFGPCAIYKFIDTEGNVLVWFTSNHIDCENVQSIVGTVKDHSEYRGTKETVLTRCKVNYA